MRIAGETVGRRGLTLLVVSAVAGVVLGAHGWSGRHNGLPPPLAGLHASATASSSPASTTTAPPSAAPSSPPSQGPVAASPSPAATSAAPAPGPKLSSQPYASYAFQVWPGPVSAAGKAALTGLVISVRRQGSGIVVTAGVAGQPAPSPRFYPAGVKVYVIEATMGDDSGNSDFNLGDDGLAVTDAQGRILQ
jgi:hypothetical protein